MIKGVGPCAFIFLQEQGTLGSLSRKPLQEHETCDGLFAITPDGRTSRHLSDRQAIKKWLFPSRSRRTSHFFYYFCALSFMIVILNFDQMSAKTCKHEELFCQGVRESCLGRRMSSHLPLYIVTASNSSAPNFDRGHCAFSSYQDCPAPTACSRIWSDQSGKHRGRTPLLSMLVDIRSRRAFTPRGIATRPLCLVKVDRWN